MNARPPIKTRHRICIICEGSEDYGYIDRLVALNVWNQIYDFKLVNAKSASNIPARFEHEYQSNRYEVILVFCDTDKEPYREYIQIKDKIDWFLNARGASKSVIIFANPCTMQVILLHFGDVNLKNQGKKTNSLVIEELRGIKNYDAHSDQIEAMRSKIKRKNYEEMKKRAQGLSQVETDSGSSNISRFLVYFEVEDIQWIKDIQEACNEKIKE